MNPHLLVTVTALLNPLGQVLMFEKTKTQTECGLVVLPGGKVENGESVIAATVRELAEELGITVDPDDLNFIKVLDRPCLDNPEYSRILSFYFTCTKWQGTPMCKESHKHGPVQWYSPAKLPSNTHKYDREVIEGSFQQGYVDYN